jgi:hypothetical protein
MVDYLLMVLENEDAHASAAPKAVANLIAEQAAFAEGLRRGGTLKDSGRFRPSKEGKRVRRVGDRAEVHDGPFVEKGRALGGYYAVEAKDLEHAAELALQCPVLPSDEVEVRPIMKGRFDADKDGKPGKIFAFGVLGNAATEEGWVAVMDRIDAESAGISHGGGGLGGVRLLPPKAGRRVATDGGRRAMFDGPFLESKEVIGGLMFIRMTSIDDAVRWASETRAVVHGTVEIRELWRT